MTVYGKIEDNTLIPAPDGEVDYLLAKGFSPFDDDLFSKCISGIITTDELIIGQENLIKKAELQSKIDELDKKRIRAIAEPSKKNEQKTWLEHYNEQIQALRAEMAGL